MIVSIPQIIPTIREMSWSAFILSTQMQGNPVTEYNALSTHYLTFNFVNSLLQYVKRWFNRSSARFGGGPTI